MGSPLGTDETGATEEGTDMTGMQDKDVSRSVFGGALAFAGAVFEARPDAYISVTRDGDKSTTVAAHAGDVTLRRDFQCDGNTTSGISTLYRTVVSDCGEQPADPIAVWVETIEAVEAESNIGAPVHLLTDPERRDVAAWNEWFGNNQPELCEPTTLLIGCDLMMADLSGVNLEGLPMNVSEMGWVVLRDANLSMVCFSQCDMTGADFSGADLRGATFTRAVLTDAVLDGAIWDEFTWWPDDFTPPERIG